jgi:hypothetical protein
MTSGIFNRLLSLLLQLNSIINVPAGIGPCPDVLVHHVRVELVLVEEALAADLADARLLVVRKMDPQEVVLKPRMALSSVFSATSKFTTTTPALYLVG